MKTRYGELYEGDETLCVLHNITHKKDEECPMCMPEDVE